MSSPQNFKTGTGPFVFSMIEEVLIIQVLKRNLGIMWVGSFLISGSFTMILPFLSLLINSMGNYSTAFVLRWSGFVFGITFVIAFIVSPMWGRFGDRYGRKKVLLFLSVGASICIFLMSFARSVYELFLLRLIIGFFAGFISMAQAFIATQTPKEIAGKVMGTLQTGAVSGGLLGPLLGGILADSFGFKYTFLLTSTIIFCTSLIILFFVQEIRPIHDKETLLSYSGKQVFRLIFTYQPLLVVMLVGMIVQIANLSIQPLLAIYVSELHGEQNLAFLSGATFSAVGFGNLLMAREWGKLGDRIGYEKVLLLLSFLGALAFFPQAFVTSIWQLILLRVFFGMIIGGVIPCITAYIRHIVPYSIQGEVLGYNTSFRFLGNVIGPVIGGFLAGIYGISSVFIITSGLFIFGGCLLLGTKNKKVEKIGKDLAN